MLARSKLNNIGMISKPLIAPEISQQDYTTIIKNRIIKDWKKILHWWRAREAMLRKINWLKKVKELELLRLFSKIMETYSTK